jgi:hypothetical protein
MSAACEREYWRRWSRVARVNRWRHVDGHLAPDAVRNGQFQAQVIHAAAAMVQPDCNLTANHLRHGCHVVALGRDVSHTALNAGQVDRLFALFKLLEDDSDLAAASMLADPDQGAVKRMVWAVRQIGFPQAYVDSVATAKFGSRYTPPYYEDLALADLRQLVLTLRERAKTSTVPRRAVETPF